MNHYWKDHLKIFLMAIYLPINYMSQKILLFKVRLYEAKDLIVQHKVILGIYWKIL